MTGSKVDVEAVLAEQALLMIKIKASKEREFDIIEKARDLKNLTDTDRELALLMRELVNQKDNQQVWVSKCKDFKKQVAEKVNQVACDMFDLGYDPTSAAKEGGALNVEV